MKAGRSRPLVIGLLLALGAACSGPPGSADGDAATMDTAPRTDAPDTDAPETDTTAVDTPAADTTADAPAADAPAADAPAADTTATVTDASPADSALDAGAGMLDADPDAKLEADAAGTPDTGNASDQGEPSDTGDSSDAADLADAPGPATPACDELPIPVFTPFPGPVKGFPVPTSHHLPTAGQSAGLVDVLPAATADVLQLPDAADSIGSCLLWRDLDGDGHAELAWVGSDDGHRAVLRIHAGGLSGAATPVSVALGPLDCDGSCANDCAAGDLDGDGQVEILVATSAGLRAVDRVGGAWVRSAELLPHEARDVPASTVDLADLDRDGLLDVYVGRYMARARGCGLSCKDAVEAGGRATCEPAGSDKGHGDLLLYGVAGGLVADKEHALGAGARGGPGSVSVGDPDRDGWPDLLVAERFGAVRWLRNDGAGGLVDGMRIQAFGVGRRPLSASLVGSLRDDGRDDVLVGGTGGAAVAFAKDPLLGSWWSGTAGLVPSESTLAVRRVESIALGGALGDKAPVWMARSSRAVRHHGACKPIGAGQHAPELRVGGQLVALGKDHPGGAIRALATGGRQVPTLAVLVGRTVRFLARPGGSAQLLRLTFEAANEGEGALVQVFRKGRVLERWLRHKTGRAAGADSALFVDLSAGPIDKLVAWFPSGRRWTRGPPLPAGGLVVRESQAAVTTVKPAPIGPCAAAPAYKPPPPPVVTGLDLLQLPLAKLTDVTGQLGLPSKESFAMCTAVADFSGDGLDDVAFVSAGLSKATVHLLRTGPGKPAVVSSPFPTPAFFPDGSCTVTDLDDDGRPDLVLAGLPGLAALHNEGGGVFKEVSATALPAAMPWSTYSVTAGDFDGDGDIDLYAGVLRGNIGCQDVACYRTGDDFLCHYGVPAKTGGQPAVDRLLLREATLPLVDRTAEYGVPEGALSPVAMSADLDRNGVMDLIVGDDFGDHRWLRVEKGKLRAYHESIGFFAWAHAMGAALGDFNGDGRFDLWMSDLGPNPVYLRVPDAKGQAVPVFREAGRELGAAAATRDMISWSPLVGDLDLDGRDDIYLPNSGWLPGENLVRVNECKAANQPPPQHDTLFLARPAGGFAVLRAPKIDKPEISPAFTAGALFDLDGDGDLDVARVLADRRIRVLRNDLPKKGSFARLRLVGKAGNRLAIGARVTVDLGPRKLVRFVATSGIGGGGSGAVHVGLGGKQAAPVTVRWPGLKGGEVTATLHAGQTLVVQE